MRKLQHATMPIGLHSNARHHPCCLPMYTKHAERYESINNRAMLLSLPECLHKGIESAGWAAANTSLPCITRHLV